MLSTLRSLSHVATENLFQLGIHLWQSMVASAVQMAKRALVTLIKTRSHSRSQSKVQPTRPNPCRSGQRISAFASLSTRSWTNSRRQWAVQCLRTAESQSIQTTMVTSEHHVYLDDSLKLEPARLPTRSLTAELEEATEERRGHT